MKYIKLIIPIALLSIFNSSCDGTKKEREKFVRPVTYQKVQSIGQKRIRTFSGTSKTDKIINLSFRNAGIITVFDLRLGQEVHKGQLLAKLDNVQPRLSYEQALTQLNSAESQMNTAKLSLNRVRSLYEQSSISLSDYEAAKNTFKTANQAFEAAKRGVAIQKEQLRYGYLYAPEDGVISAVNVEIDENVSPGQPIATLNAGSDMEVLIGIPESVINGVERDMVVDIAFTSIPDAKYKGKVTEVAPALDMNTSTYPIRIAIKNPSQRIKSGMTANVTFNFNSSKDNGTNLIVPAVAVGEDSDGRFVFLVEEQGERAIVKKHHIVIGNLTTEGFEVKSGLSEGQKIATAGLQTLQDGQEVAVK